jgi:polyhydroxybutyrate depolymerase
MSKSSITCLTFFMVIGLIAGLHATDAAAWGRFSAGRLNAYRPAGGDPSSLQFDGRDYLLHMPQPQARGKMPLLVVLHGGLGNAAYIQARLGMDSIADRDGFMVAYLNGTEGRLRIMRNKRTWNAGGCCGIAQRENVDDVGYIHDFISFMIANHHADPSRIYLLGHSNGSMMAYRFVCDAPGIVSAMVAISGPLMTEGCSPVNGLRVLHIQSAGDQHVPIAGGMGSQSVAGVSFRPLAESKKILTDAGASVTVKLLPGNAHNLEDIRQTFDVPGQAAAFLLNK